MATKPPTSIDISPPKEKPSEIVLINLLNANGLGHHRGGSTVPYFGQSQSDLFH